jgi:hypothetical protein
MQKRGKTGLFPAEKVLVEKASCGSMMIFPLRHKRTHNLKSKLTASRKRGIAKPESQQPSGGTDDVQSC